VADGLLGALIGAGAAIIAQVIAIGWQGLIARKQAATRAEAELVGHLHERFWEFVNMSAGMHTALALGGTVSPEARDHYWTLKSDLVRMSAQADGTIAVEMKKYMDGVENDLQLTPPDEQKETVATLGPEAMAIGERIFNGANQMNAVLGLHLRTYRRGQWVKPEGRRGRRHQQNLRNRTIG
jgi:hypothetical protein